MEACNHCGACCRRGGECVLRAEVGMPADFEGRCDFHIDRPDGTTRCRVMLGMHELERATWGIDGDCDFPELRTEIGKPS